MERIHNGLSSVLEAISEQPLGGRPKPAGVFTHAELATISKIRDTYAEAAGRNDKYATVPREWLLQVLLLVGEPEPRR